ncbi:GGDEF domain-containing protein [Demequina phytophila]|uniref:GGDEF domain-containing protein n=1 Tax=Demequina phytophila TaxID=1638981 RepID=UPI0007864C0E|nr:diguanylate cyclase [Demequina phytophila]
MSRRLAVRSPSDPLPWAFGAVIVGLVVIGLTTLGVRASVSADAENAAIQGATLVGDATAVQLEGATRPAEAAARGVAASVAADPSIVQDSERVLDELGPLMDGQAAIAAITVIGEDGTVVELDRRSPGIVRTPAAPEATWIEEARRSGTVVWSDPERAREVGRTVVHAALAARDGDGEPVAVVAVRLDAGMFTGALSGSPAMTYGDASVIGSNGVTLAGDPALTLPDDAVTERASAGIVALGNPVTYARAVSDSLPWTLTVAVDADAALPAVASVEHTMVLYTVVIVVVTLIMSLVLWALRRPAGEVSVRARTDPLTGLSNRHHFEVRGNDVLQAARRRDGQVVVAVFDLDNFKAVNDGAGHEAGDDALRAVADGLARASGPRDVVGRLGGDEFAAVLWLSADEDPGHAVERLRTSAHMTLERAVGERFEVGVSAGWADTANGEYRLPVLVRAADEAMVGGRRSGKGVSYEATRR